MDPIERRVLVLERHLQRSQRTNRVLSFAVVIILCIAGAQMTSSQPPKSSSETPSQSSQGSREIVGPEARGRSGTIEADQIVLVDPFGRSRVSLTATGEGAAISMFDEQGKKRLELGCFGNSSGLRLLDSQESAIVSLHVPNRADQAQLEIRSATGSTLTKASGFVVRDADEHSCLQLALLNGNFPLFGIGRGGVDGPHSIEMTASGESPSLKMHDNNGYPLFSLTSDAGGNSTLGMRHPGSERSLQISMGPRDIDSPVMRFFAPANEDGSGGQVPMLQVGLDRDQHPFLHSIGSLDRTGQAAGSPPRN